MGQPAACVGDAGDHGGAIQTGSGSVNCEGKPLSGKGDMMACPKHGPGPLDKSSSNVNVCGKGVVRVSDLCDCGSSGAAGAKVPAAVTPDAVELDEAGMPKEIPGLSNPAANDPEAAFDASYGPQEAKMEWTQGVDSKLKISPHGSGDKLTGIKVEGHILDVNVQGDTAGSILGPGYEGTYAAEVKVGDFAVDYNPDANTYSATTNGVVSGNVSVAANDGLGNTLEVKGFGGYKKAVLYGAAGDGRLAAGAQVKPVYGGVNVSGSRRFFEADGVEAPDQFRNVTDSDWSRMGLLEKAIYYGHQATSEVLQWAGYFPGGGLIGGVKESTAKGIAEAVGYSAAEAEGIATSTLNVNAYGSMSKGTKGSSYDLYGGAEDADVGAEGFAGPKGKGEWGLKIQIGNVPPKSRSTESGSAGKQGVTSGASKTFVGG